MNRKKCMNITYILTGILSVIIIVIVILNYKFKSSVIFDDSNNSDNLNTDIEFFNNVNKLDGTKYQKIDFPSNDFLWGFSTAPYQFEGGSGFRGLSNWDAYLYSNQGTLGITGRDGTDFFNRYKSDIKRMKLMGVNALRVGISWPRLFYDGENTGKPKPIGVQFYKNLINELIKNNITPIICLMHWDYPLTLQNKLKTHNGKLRAFAATSKDVNSNGEKLINILLSAWTHYIKSIYEYILKDYLSDIYYISTINEINTITSNAYMQGVMAPGLSINRQAHQYGEWNDVYWSLYNLLTMHHIAYKIHLEYTTNLHKYPFLTVDNDPVSFPIDFDVKTGKKTVDAHTYQRALDFNVFNVLDPLIFGKWSPAMEKLFNTKNNSFRGEFPPVDISHFKGSIQKIIPFHYYFSVNVKSSGYEYLADYINDKLSASKTHKEILKSIAGKIYSLDGRFNVVWPPVTYNIPAPFNKKELPASLSWIGFYPEGAAHLANQYANRYKNFDLIITECGLSPNVKTRETINDTLNDTIRITLYDRLFSSLLDPTKSIAVKEKRLKGALLWSFSDNLEWADGYASVFGTYYVNFWGPGKFLLRTPKISSGWFKLVSKYKRIISDKCAPELLNNLVINPALYTSNGISDKSLLNVPLNNVILLAKPSQLGYSSDDRIINGYSTNKIELSGAVRQDKPVTPAEYNISSVNWPFYEPKY